jgi:hypothetical protein
LIDVVPNQYITLSISAGDTPLGIVWTTKRLIPRSVTYQRDAKTGAFTADLDCEAEAIGITGVTYTPPAVSSTPTPPVGTSGPVYPPTPTVTLIKRFGWSLVLDGINNGLISTGYVAAIEVPFLCKIDSVKLVAKPGISGTIYLDLQKCAFALIGGGHPVVGDSMVGSGVHPYLASANTCSIDLSGWTTVTLNAGDWLFVYVTSTNLDLVTLAITGYAYQ